MTKTRNSELCHQQRPALVRLIVVHDRQSCTQVVDEFFDLQGGALFRVDGVYAPVWSKNIALQNYLQHSIVNGFCSEHPWETRKTQTLFWGH
mgnify:CR=1 FL=1